jgi:hypothetical protein
MPNHETHQATARHRRTRQHPSAWHRVLLLGVCFILMSLCHSIVAPVEASAPTGGVAVAAAANDEPTPFRECAATKRMVALSDRRGSAPALDLPPSPSVFTAHLPEGARGLRLEPQPLPENHRAFLQVFRI